MGDLLAAPVREGEGQGHLRVAGALATERVEHGAHEAGQASEVADGVQADAVLQDLVALGEQKVTQELHERIDFVFRARPVLLAEGVEREGVKAEAARDAHDAPYGRGPFVVACRARPATELRPTPVPIHDDADMPGEIAGFDEGHIGVAR